MSELGNGIHLVEITGRLSLQAAHLVYEVTDEIFKLLKALHDRPALKGEISFKKMMTDNGGNLVVVQFNNKEKDQAYAALDDYNIVRSTLPDVNLNDEFFEVLVPSSAVPRLNAMMERHHFGKIIDFDTYAKQATPEEVTKLEAEATQFKQESIDPTVSLTHDDASIVLVEGVTLSLTEDSENPTHVLYQTSEGAVSLPSANCHMQEDKLMLGIEEKALYLLKKPDKNVEVIDGLAFIKLLQGEILAKKNKKKQL